MTVTARSTLLRYGGAALAVLLATGARLALDPILGDQLPFATLYFAVLIAAGYGGRGPALLATTLGALASARFLLAPRDGLAVRGFENQAGILLYGAVGTGIALLGGAMQSARRRAEASSDAAIRKEVHANPSDEGLSESFRDVTGRKCSEEEYARLVATSEQQRRIYETALSNSPDFHYVFDLEGRFTYVNEALLGLWRKGLDEALGRRFFDLDYPPDLAARLHRQIQQVIDTKRPVKDETPYTSHLGEREYEYILVPVLGGGGAVEAVAGSTRDFTERKLVEESLRESEERFRASVDQAAVGVALVGLDHRTIFANRGLCEMLGYAEAELLAKSFIDVTHPDDLDLDFRQIPRLLSGEVSSCRYEKRYLRKDGSVMWGDLSVAAVRDDRGVSKYFVGVLVDITTQREARRDLEESERRFRTLADHAPVGIFQTDARGHCVYVNDKWCQLTGLTPAEASGPGWAAAIHEEDRRRVADEWYTAARSGMAYSGEFRFRSPQGVTSWVQSGAVALRDDGREVIGHLGTTTDITEQKRLQDDLRLTKEVAEQRAAELDAVIDSMPDAVYFGTAGGMTKCNAHALEMLGITPLSDLPCDFAGLRDRFTVRWPESGELLKPEELQFARALHGETAIQEVVIRRLDRGADVHVRVAAAPVVLNGEIVGAVAVNSDITDRKRAEERGRRAAAEAVAAAEANAKFRTFFEQGSYFAGLLALDGTLVESNRLSSDASGFARGDLIGKKFWEIGFWSPSATLAGRMRAAVLRAAAGHPFHEEMPYFMADGSERVVDAHLSPVTDDEGRVLFVAASGTDITDRKRAEEAVRASEGRFRHLADAMPQIVWVTRPDRSVEYVNRRWLDYTGQTPEEALGPEGWASAVHPEDIGRIMEASVRSHATGEPFEAEYRIKDASGAYRWHLGRAVPVFDEAGRVIRRFGAATDIDDRRRAEQAARFLAEASATLSALVDEAGTLEKVARLAVPAFADWCSVDMAGEDGFPRRLAVAHVDPAKVEHAHDLLRRYPPDPDSPHGVPRVIRTGESQLVPEIGDDLLAAGARDDAHLALIRDLGLRSYLCVPLKGRGGTLGAITFVAAESGRRYGPDDLRLAEDLASRAAIAIENARLYAELREADRRKDEFLATLAHELRNPLAPIRNALHLMAHPSEDRKAHEAERAMAERQVVHLARLIDDLMDVARIARGKIELHKEVVDLATIVRQAVESARPLIDGRRHRLTVSLPEGPTRLEGDPTRLEQVLWNLLNNAAKYSEPGGAIELVAERDGGEVVVLLRDTGIGIAPEMLPRVFDIFVQVEGHKGHAQGGLGIGLSLVRTLVQMHGGSISARSEGPGTGSEFVVRLPLLPQPIEAETPAREERREAADRPPRRRILVVDDNVDAARSLARLLARLYGQDVRVAHDGPEALGVAGEYRPEVVLLDIGLPGMDGNEVARRLRDQPEFEQTLIVALTGWGQESDLEKSRAAGFDHHLVKPASPEVILELLTKAGESGQ